MVSEVPVWVAGAGCSPSKSYPACQYREDGTIHTSQPCSPCKLRILFRISIVCNLRIAVWPFLCLWPCLIRQNTMLWIMNRQNQYILNRQNSDIVLIFTWKCALSKFASKFCPIFLNHKQLKNTQLLILCWVAMCFCRLTWVFAMFFLNSRPVFDEIFVFLSKFRYMKTPLPVGVLIFFNSSERGWLSESSDTSDFDIKMSILNICFSRILVCKRRSWMYSFTKQ